MSHNSLSQNTPATNPKYRNRIRLILVITLFVVQYHAIRADEGMWLLNMVEQLNYGKMKEMGLKLTPEQIYSVEHSSLKDAVPIFGGGCTGEMISSKGLLMTNLHCGYGEVQSHSTLEHDYLANGFWATSREQELPTPALSVRFVISIDDVTDKVLDGVTPKMSEIDRTTLVTKNSKLIEQESIAGTHYEASVKSFYAGNQYFLFKFERFTDVRLVGSPPVSIGDFGSLTDNWMWPRHKADFVLFRVYASSDGKPANYSPNNVPYSPKHYFPISTKGVEQGDFAMVIGYPGTTDRYLSSYGINELIEVTHPNRIKIRGEKLDIIDQYMQQSKQARLQYAAEYKSSSNYWKHSLGQRSGLKRLRVYEKQQLLENQFNQWVNTDKQRFDKYGTALTTLQKTYEGRKPMLHASQYIREAFISGPEIFNVAYRTNRLVTTLQTGDKTSIFEALKQYKAQMATYYKNFNAETDRKILVALLNFFIEDVPKEYHPSCFQTVNNKAAIELFANKIYEQSIFADNKKMDFFLLHPDAEKLRNDPALKAANEIYDKYFELIDNLKAYARDIEAAERLYISGLMEMQPDRMFYPDANSTLRLTYGKVNGYKGYDAVNYMPFTTLSGVMQKEDPDNYEFIVPKKLKELYAKKNYGIYGTKGEMRVCFIADTDITGGNSGSPVIGANGELVGLAFDSNWEGLSGDINYEADFKRTICVDIRYILFIIDKYANADYIMKELTILK